VGRRPDTARLAWAGLLGWLLFGAPVFAENKPQLRSQYEEKLIADALDRRKLSQREIDPQPDGKLIEEILIDAGKVILPGDFPLSQYIPWTWLNALHVRTRDEVIARELLFHVGEPFRRDVFEESGRNLRTLFILSVARLVALRGSTPDKVRVLVVTKDQWSLRLNTEFRFDQARLDVLSFQFAEHNLAGRNKRLSVDFGFDPGRFSLGMSYSDLRIWGSRHQLKLIGGLYLSRETSNVEGGQLYFQVGRPLFSLRTRFGWEAKLQVTKDIARYFSGGVIYLRRVKDEDVPDVYRREQVAGQVQVQYSAGIVHKLNLSLGWRVQHQQYNLPDDFPDTISDAARTAYRQLLPRSESASGPFVGLNLFTARFIRLKDIQTLALTEDLRLGPELNLELRYAWHGFGFSSDYLEASGSLASQHYLGDNLFSYQVSAGVRLQYGIDPRGELLNEYLTAQVREITPAVGPLRLHLSAKLQLRGRDLEQQRMTLGSDSGLRGYAPRAIQGGSLYRVNAELRTKGLNLWTIHVGGVVFYDGGDAPPVLNGYLRDGSYFATSYRHDVGFGLRLGLPQFNREVIRLDLGFPLESPSPGSVYAPRFSAEFGQAF
jgi:ssRNA-specific RNase YbeY (16S rRNA maturation enzyme)